MGGHGGLNILPQKSWNVYNRKNREIVEKDEREAAEAEEKLRKRAAQAEHEHRISILKDRTKRLRGDGGEEAGASSSSAAAGPSSPPRHINFFQEAQEAIENAEYVAEKRAEKAKAEAPFTMFLGQGSAELQEKKPWYWGLDNPEKVLTDKQRARAEATKVREDPLSLVNRSLKRKDPGGPLPPGAAGFSARPDAPSYRDRLKGFTPEGETSVAASAGGAGKAAGGKKSIEQLRAERLERERRERERAAALVSGSAAPAPGGRGGPGREAGGYNSSFLGYSGGQLRALGAGPPHRSGRS